jgi:hypothetical protein
MNGILPYDYPFVKSDFGTASGWKELVAISGRSSDPER